jgi:hypothetical protein
MKVFKTIVNVVKTWFIAGFNPPRIQAKLYDSE